MAILRNPMTDPDPTTDPDGADVGVSNGAGSDPDGADGREPAAGAGRRATPRLADAPDAADGDATDDPEFREPEPIEPEPLRAENALFVLLGVLGTVALLATVIVPGVL